MVVLYAARHRVAVPSLARWLLALGIAVTLTANMAQGWSHGPVGAVVAAWPAVSLVGSYELLVWLIRTSGPTTRGLSAEQHWKDAACHAAVRERGTSDSAWRTASPAAGQPPILDGGQAADEVLKASVVNDAAVAAYRLSVQAGSPLSERRLAQMFGRTSRRWARARIADARRAEPLQAPSTPAMALSPLWRHRGKPTRTGRSCATYPRTRGWWSPSRSGTCPAPGWRCPRPATACPGRPGQAG